MLGHEQLDVYQAAIELQDILESTVKQMPKGNSELTAQLRRAGFSVPLNIAEAMGRLPGADRKRFLSYARGSAYECSAVLDIMHARFSFDVQVQKLLIVRIVSMLTKLMRLQRSTSPS